MERHVMRHWTISAKIKTNIDCPTMVVFFNMLFFNITMSTTFITVHSIQFQILDFAIKYQKVSVSLLLTFWGRKLKERKYFGYTQLCFIE